MFNQLGSYLDSAVRSIIEWDTVTLIGFFTALDLFAYLLYWLYTQDILHSRFFRIGKDLGFGEFIQYFKNILVVFMIWQWYKRRSTPILRAWTIFFVAMLLDNSIGIHEEIGAGIMAVYPISAPAGIRAKDIAEHFGFALVEGSALIYVFYCFIRASKTFKQLSIYLFLALLPLVLAGVVLDFTNLHFYEVTGQMIGMSILLAFVHWYHQRTEPESLR